MNIDVLKEIEELDSNKAFYTAENTNWLSRLDQDHMLWLRLDKKDSSTNTISAEVLQELDEILTEVEKKSFKALIIGSAKPAGFCAGADINAFKNTSESEMTNLLKRGHEVLDRLAAMTIPTIAVIHGHCLGGGLELALACQKRIGIKGGLEMGFPEIRLGVHPGLGGTFRLNRLISPIAAMTMMLTGKSIYGIQAKKRGLIDELIERRHIENAVHATISGKIKQRRRSLKNYLLNTPVARKITAKKMRAVSEEKASPTNYPAPYALIDLWEQNGVNIKKMQAAEVVSFAKLMAGETAQNLVRAFFLHQSLKSLAKNRSGIRHVHVIGAGSMGGDIAGWCALRGLTVTLSDQKAEPLAQAINKTEQLCQKKHQSEAETQRTLDRLIPERHNTSLEKADLIIEAIPEKIDAKLNLYQLIEPKIKDSAVLVSNTSSISIEELAGHLKNPARFMGLHFFNPVSRMLMVEVIAHKNTSSDILQQMLSFTGDIGKIPVPVTSAPGFLVNRALTPYLLEAIVMLEEGIDKERIDGAAKNFGMPVGPIELSDQIGLDICIHVADMLARSLDKPMAKIPDGVRIKVSNGELGKKTGKGFYVWKNGKVQQKNNIEKKADNKITNRLILPLLDACVECYRKGVVNNFDQLDGAMIFATGFAPFRGGPIHYARTRGVDEIVNTLEKLAESYGERFTPDKGWKDL